MESGEIDVVDFLVLTHLRMTFPVLYAKLPLWQSGLTGQGSLLILKAGRDKPADWSGRIRGAGVPDAYLVPVTEVLTEMFPAMSGGSRSRTGGCRAHDPDYFDRYFSVGISGDDIPDSVVKRALREAAAGVPGAGLRSLEGAVRGDSEELAQVALRKAARLSEEIENSQVWTLVTYVAALAPSVPDRPSIIFNAARLALNWFARLLLAVREAPSHEEIDRLGSARSVEP